MVDSFELKFTYPANLSGQPEQMEIDHNERRRLPLAVEFINSRVL